MSDSDAADIADVLKVSTTIEVVDLSNNNIGDKGAVAIANMLRVNTALTTLASGLEIREIPLTAESLLEDTAWVAPSPLLIQQRYLGVVACCPLLLLTGALLMTSPHSEGAGRERDWRCRFSCNRRGAESQHCAQSSGDRL